MTMIVLMSTTGSLPVAMVSPTINVASDARKGGIVRERNGATGETGGTWHRDECQISMNEARQCA